MFNNFKSIKDKISNITTILKQIFLEPDIEDRQETKFSIDPNISLVSETNVRMIVNRGNNQDHPKWPLSWVPPKHLRHPDWSYDEG